MAHTSVNLMGKISKLNIKSSYLLSISKVNAQRMIMNVLKEDLKTKIHALEIKIEQ